MMEIIDDVAPGATLAFHTAFDGQADFAQGILDLKKAGAKVIVDDVGYIHEPMFQDGIIAQAVDRVVARRAAYFSAAGNDARQSYQSRFRPSGRFVQEGPNLFCEAHDFDPGSKVDVRQRIRLPAGGLLNLSFQWDQPFFSVSGAPGAASDLDILVFDAARNFVSGGTRTIASGDPVEFFEFQNLGGSRGIQYHDYQLLGRGKYTTSHPPSAERDAPRVGRTHERGIPDGSRWAREGIRRRRLPRRPEEALNDEKG